jgi:putative endopeptidase
MRKLSILFMVCVIFATFSVPVLANDEVSATRGEIVQSLLTAADFYNPGMNKETIIKGYENGGLKENQPVKKIEALVMLSRAFGELPKPQGNDLRIGTFGVEFTDVPDWAKEDIAKLSAAGVLAGKPDGTLGANDPITIEEFQTIIARVWSLEGSNLKDDFYETINKKWLNSSIIAAGDRGSGTFDELRHSNFEKLENILDELTDKQFGKGTKEQKLADFYTTALDTENRNKQGIEPIQKYIEAFDESKTLDELVQADLIFEKETGQSTLFSLGSLADAKNSNINALYYLGLSVGLDKHSFVTEDAKAKELYIKYMSKLLVLAGEEESAANARAEKIYEMEKNLASVMRDRHEYSDPAKYYNPYTIEQFYDLFKEVDMKQVVKSLKYDSADKVIVWDVKLAQKGAEYLTQNNLELLKSYSKVKMLIAASEMLSDDFRDVKNEFEAGRYGNTGKKTDKEIAFMITKGSVLSPSMGDYLEQKYVEKYFSNEAKQDVENMAKQFIAAYKDRIKALEWMSETTKAKAIKKLDTMKVKVGYPDKWDSPLNNVTIKTYDEGGSLFANISAINTAHANKSKENLGNPVDKNEWIMISAFDVIAVYDPRNNDITFPAGILQAPVYDINAKPEENIGAIGNIIGHEISHAFDNRGSAYDEHGDVNNWWTEEDYEKFTELCQEVIDFYNGIEIVPGAVIDGQLTLGENIADLGGMAVSLQVLSQMTSPDYKAYFESYANYLATTTTKEYEAYLSTNNTHSTSKVLVNRTIVNFPEFYKTYGIEPWDGMYVAPEDRVSIW